VQVFSASYHCLALNGMTDQTSEPSGRSKANMSNEHAASIRDSIPDDDLLALTPAEREIAAAQNLRLRETRKKELALLDTLAAEGKLSAEQVEEHHTAIEEKYNPLFAKVRQQFGRGKLNGPGES
jgi:hypothetical protein